MKTKVGDNIERIIYKYYMVWKRNIATKNGKKREKKSWINLLIVG